MRAFRDQPILFFAAAQGRFRVRLFLFGLLFLQDIEDGGGEALQTALENIIIGAFFDAFDGHLFGTRSGDENERNVAASFLEQPERFQGVEFREAEIGQDQVR